MSELLICPKGHRWNPAVEGRLPMAGPGAVCPVCGAGSEVEPTSNLLAELTDPDGELPPPPRPRPAAVVEVAAGMFAPPRRQVEPTRPTVAGYEILATLGRGGMAVVYQARQVKLQRVVALKVILAGAHASPEELARFRTEAEAVARLRHPNIVQIHAVGEQDGCAHFSLEFVEGGSLAHQLAGTPQPARPSAQLVETLARAIHFAHERGIIHRDLKPANVLLTADGTPKITDFGLAKFLRGQPEVSAPGYETKTGQIIGTPHYMAPEQTQGDPRAVGPAADVYALGAILYECLIGRPPFKAETPLATMHQVQCEEPVPPRRFLPRVPRDLETICLKCLRKEPRKRYADAAALAEDLRRFVAGEPIRARPVAVWERGLKWVRRHPALAALVAVTVAAVLGLWVGVVWHNLQLSAARKQEAEQRRKAEQESDRANANLQKARANRRQALAAVNQMFTRVAGERLLKQAQMVSLRLGLFDDALQFLVALYQEDSGDPQVQQELGRAYARVGEVHHALGRYPEAEKHYRQGLAHHQELLARFADEPAYQHDLGKHYIGLGSLFRDTDRPGEAEQAFVQARDLQEKLVAGHRLPEYRRELARCHNLLNALFQERKRPQEAAQACQKALVVLEELVAEYPKQPIYRKALAVSCNNLGNSLKDTGSLPEAEQYYRKALALQEELWKEKEVQGRPDYGRDLAISHYNLGLLFMQVGLYDSLLASLGPDCHNLGLRLAAIERLREAEKHYRQAVNLQQELVKKFESWPVFPRDLAESLQKLGELLTATHRPQEAVEAHRRAQDLRKGLTVAPAAGVPDSR